MITNCIFCSFICTFQQQLQSIDNLPIMDGEFTQPQPQIVQDQRLNEEKQNGQQVNADEQEQDKKEIKEVKNKLNQIQTTQSATYLNNNASAQQGNRNKEGFIYEDKPQNPENQQQLEHLQQKHIKHEQQKQSKQQQEKQNDHLEQENQFAKLNVNEIISQNRKIINVTPSRTHSDGNQLQYIEHIFKYYCKSTYSTGKFITFELIKQKTNLLNINTFTAFCRDFRIGLDRQKLIEIFKKSTNYKSTMGNHELIQALYMIGKQLFPAQQQQNEELKKWQQFHKLIKLLQLHNENAFNNKMIQINMKYRQKGIKPKQNKGKLNKSNSYKFKFESCNGRDQSQIKQQIQYRKKNKEQMKLVVNKLREIRQKNEVNRFEKFNVLSIGEKKITKGGYMSPPLTNIHSPSGINKNNVSTFGKNTRIISKVLSQNQSQIVTIEPSSYARSRQRHYTDLEPETVSIQNSTVLNYQGLIYRSQQSKRKSPSPIQLSPNNNSRFKHLPNKNIGYMHSYVIKNKKEMKASRYNKNEVYQINPVIKHARQVEDSKIMNRYGRKKNEQSSNIFDIDTSSQKMTQEMGRHKTHTNSTLMQRFEINPVTESKQEEDLGLFADIEEQDEYLSKLNRLSIIENQNKKRVDKV